MAVDIEHYLAVGEQNKNFVAVEELDLQNSAVPFSRMDWSLLVKSKTLILYYSFHKNYQMGKDSF